MAKYKGINGGISKISDFINMNKYFDYEIYIDTLDVKDMSIEDWEKIISDDSIIEKIKKTCNVNIYNITIDKDSLMVKVFLNEDIPDGIESDIIKDKSKGRELSMLDYVNKYRISCRKIREVEKKC